MGGVEDAGVQEAVLGVPPDPARRDLVLQLGGAGPVDLGQVLVPRTQRVSWAVGSTSVGASSVLQYSH